MLNTYYMRFFLFAVGLFASLANSAQVTTVLVEHLGTTTAYSELQTAISAAPSGAKIYLSGGIHNPTGVDIIVDKPLEFIGAGFDLDTLVATNASIVRGDFTLITGADNCILRGFKVEDGKLDIGSGTSSTDDITNLFAELCWFEDGIDFSDSGNSTSPPSFMLIRHCVFADVSMSYAHNVTLQNCLIFGNITTAYNGITVDHCLFENGSSVSVESINGMLTNNIYLGSSFFASGESNIFANSIFVDTTPGFDVEDQVENMYIATEISLFGENLDLNFNPDVDYSTLSSSIANSNATDGSFIGHDGGIAPWPENYLTVYPYIWNSSTIDSQTNSSGDLPVNIKVSAQGQ